MKRRLVTITTMLFALAFAAMAADVTGKWVGQVQGRNGAQDVTFNLKADGSKLTGTVLGGGGRGVAAPLNLARFRTAKSMARTFRLPLRRSSTVRPG